MKAWQVTELGAPAEVLRLADVPEPVVGAGQVLVRVAACALNFPDVLLARGLYQVRPPLPFTPGIEVCGTVVAVGEGADAGLAGRRVVGMPELPGGGLAEYAVLPGALVHDAPASLDDAEAAALHVAYQTAWFALHRRARLAAGETVLVHAAAGGVGSATVQLAKAAGATVVAMVGSEEKAAVARELGADAVLDRRHDDLVASVRELTGGRGADVVVDPVGGDSFDASTRCLAFEGRIVVVGFTSGRIPTLAANHVLLKNYGVLGLHWGSYRTRAPELVHEAHAELVALAGSGVVRPLVSERLPFEAARDGLRRLEAGETVGRLVVQVS